MKTYSSYFDIAMLCGCLKFSELFMIKESTVFADVGAWVRVLLRHENVQAVALSRRGKATRVGQERTFPRARMELSHP